MKRPHRIAARLVLVSCGLLIGSGCAPYTRAQIDLVDQAKRGIALIAQNDQDRDRAIEELAKLRHQKLDDAFDEDVRTRAARESLDPDWVIESRKAYAAGLDAFAKAQAASDRAGEVRKQNLAAIDTALDRLRWMQSIELNLEQLPDEVKK
jgi:hypothetical protein